MSTWPATVLLILALQLQQLPVCRSWNFLPLNEAAVREVLGAAMRCQNLPQLHVAAVQAGRELHRFQLELLPNNSVVDIAGHRRVLLPIASVSKGMFSTALPLVQEQLRRDRGNPSFDLLTTPIKQLLGDENFWFLDQSRTDSVTIEDLTSHTTGLNRHDVLSIWSGIRSKSELAQLTGRLIPAAAFRGSFIYNNLVWTIADQVVERLTSKNFTAYMRQFLWQPLGMTDAVGSSEMDSRSRVQQLFRSPKHFKSGRIPFERTELERSLDIVEAAGGIYASLADMVKYMQHHTRANFSSHLPPPEPFKAVNAFAAQLRAGGPSIFNDSVTDLPDIDRESYGHGWFRTWYRDTLTYEHGGSFFGAHCHLRVLSKGRLSVFAHISLGQSDSPFQAAYAEILGHYITDMLLRNASFVTRDNVCTLFRPPDKTQPPVAVPRRSMTAADVQFCSGSFGNYGLGTVTVSLNASSGLLNAVYGTAALEMVPVQLPGRPVESDYSFFLSILRPAGLPLGSPIVDSNASHVMVSPEVLLPGPPQPPQTALFMRIWRRLPGDGRVLVNSPAFDAVAVLEKGLRPEGWQRPEPCPKGAAATGAAGICWLMAMTTALACRAFAVGTSTAV